MQRYNLNLKGGTYSEGNSYELNPILRQQVVPGQTVNIDFEASLKTAAFTKLVTTPCIFSVWFFYVPHRLSWADWPDFISKQDGAPAFPTSTAEFAFDHGNAGVQFNVLYRRAYKLVYNEYFGTESVGSSKLAWYDDPTDDSVTAQYRTKNPEQFASRIQLDAAVVDPEFTVSGSVIPLNDFYRQMMNARSTQRSQMTGDKYVDTLARMGVDATWMIAERPEFLGTKSMMVAPQITTNTSNTNTGEEIARFNSNLKCSIKSKHFAEHGYIVGVASCRPIVMVGGRGSADCVPTGGNWIDSFYSADNLETKDVVDDDIYKLTSGNALTQRFGYLRNGMWQRGSYSTWLILQSITDFGDFIYPDGTSLPVGDELSGRDYAVTTSFTMSGKTPVPTRVA